MNSKGYCDVVFPLRLGVLTYSIPEGLEGLIKPGMLVEAPLKKRSFRGILLRLAHEPDKTGEIQPLKRPLFDFPLLSEELLRLLQWMAGYYLSEEGSVLRCMLPSFIFKKKRINLVRPERGDPERIVLEEFGLSTDAYKTILLKGDLLKKGLLKGVLDRVKSAIILVPSINIVLRLKEYLMPYYGERVLLYHSQMKSSDLERSYQKALEGRYIIVGTRNVVFLPFRPSIIIVFDEGSYSYRQEETPSFNARDVAVMRAYLEGFPVFLVSEHPSLESFYNARINKYKLIDLRDSKRITVRINRIRRPSQGTLNILPEGLLKKIEGYVKRNERVFIEMPRTGYSTIYCRDCGRVYRCECEGVFVYYKKENLLRCRLCEKEISPPDTCPYCRGLALEFRSAGIERVGEILKERLSESSLRLITLSSSARGLPEEEEGLPMAGFSLAVMIDADIILNMPDYKASERLLHEVYYLNEIVRPGGEILIQTRMPEYEVFKYLRSLDYTGFALQELKTRREHRLPPYSRFIVLRLFSKKEIDTEQIQRRLRVLPLISLRNLVLKRRKRGGPFQSAFLLRFPRGTDLQALQEILLLLRREGIEVRVEADLL